MKIVTIYNNYGNSGGAQNVSLLLASHFTEPGQLPIVLTSTPLDKIASGYFRQANFDNLRLGSVRKIVKKYPDAIFLSHDRKSTSKLMLYRLLLGNRMHVVHVSHNIFTDLKFFTWLPKNIISISTAVTDNLKSYFGVTSDRITYIPNGIPDKEIRVPRKSDVIKILIAGRLSKVKRQVFLANSFKGNLPLNVEVYFAGTGEQEEALLEVISGENNLYYLGQININEEIHNYDYVLLFSEKEGLPLVLLEACMYGKPMITNDISSVMDINLDGQTGYICHDITELIHIIIGLPSPGSLEYNRMSNNARQRYEKLYRIEKMYAEYDKLLKRVSLDV